MVEHEKKILLTQEEYNTVKTLLYKGVFLKTQTNYYFDTNDFTMNRTKTTCRIRAKDGKFVATIKSHCRDIPGCSVEMDICEKSEFDPQIFNTWGLCYQGELFTERWIMHKDGVCEVALDRNSYLGCVDYELEIEYKEEGEKRAQDILERIAHTLLANGLLTDVKAFYKRVKTSKSKSERFFARKQDLRYQQCDLF